MASETDTDLARIELIRSATQYYIAGRFAAITLLFPVSGNLLHHAVELYLKGILAKHYSLAELWKFNHHLLKIWPVFKKKFQLADLSKFDPAIERLDRFERIRYPDKLLNEGMSGLLASSVQDFDQMQHNEIREPKYQLVLEEVDELVKVVFQLSGLNPRFFFDGIDDIARHFLLLRNAHSLISNEQLS